MSHKPLLHKTLQHGWPPAFFANCCGIRTYGKKISSRLPLDNADNRCILVLSGLVGFHYTKGIFMNDVLLFGSIATVVVCCLAMFAAYGIYGGVHGSLSTAKAGEFYNFEYLQPNAGDPERYLAKVLSVHVLDDNAIRRLNTRSAYRRNDSNFQRSNHLVTCQTADGKIRNFYAERTVNCRRPLLAGAAFKTGLANLLF